MLLGNLYNKTGAFPKWIKDKQDNGLQTVLYLVVFKVNDSITNKNLCLIYKWANGLTVSTQDVREVMVRAACVKGELKASQPGITQLRTGHFSWSGAFTCLCSLCHTTLMTSGLTSTPITCSFYK